MLVTWDIAWKGQNIYGCSVCLVKKVKFLYFPLEKLGKKWEGYQLGSWDMNYAHEERDMLCDIIRVGIIWQMEETQGSVCRD